MNAFWRSVTTPDPHAVVNKSPDPMLSALDESALKIAQSYEKLAKISPTPKEYKAASQSVQSSIAPVLSSAVINDGSIIHVKSVVQPKNSAKINMSAVPSYASPVSALKLPESSAATPNAIAQTSRTQIKTNDAIINQDNPLKTIVNLPGWTGTPERATKIVAAKIGYTVHVSGARRAAEPLIVMSVNPQTAFEAFRDIGIQSGERIMIRIEGKNKIVRVIYKG